MFFVLFGGRRESLQWLTTPPGRPKTSLADNWAFIREFCSTHGLKSHAEVADVMWRLAEFRQRLTTGELTRYPVTAISADKVSRLQGYLVCRVWEVLPGHSSAYPKPFNRYRIFKPNSDVPWELSPEITAPLTRTIGEFIRCARELKRATAYVELLATAHAFESGETPL